MTHARFHTALNRIHVGNVPAAQRLFPRLSLVLGGALPTLCEAAAESLSLDTLPDLTAVWASQAHRHRQSAPEIPEAIFELLVLVRSMPFGADALGAYLAVHWKEGAIDIGELVEERRAIERGLAHMPSGFTGELHCSDGPVGRRALRMMAAIVERGDVDIGSLEVTVRCSRADSALLSIVPVLASCFVHGCLPSAIEFTADSESLCRLDCPTPHTSAAPTEAEGFTQEVQP